MSFDNVCKPLAEKYPFDFAKWLLPQEPKTIKVLKRVKVLSVEQLENLGAALFNISEVADLITWLNQQDS